MLEHAVAEFGRRLGIEGLNIPEGQTLDIELSDTQKMSLLVTETELLLWFEKNVPADSAANIYARVLEEINWRRALPLAIAAALYRDKLILSTRLSNASVTGADIETALMTLSDFSTHFTA